MIGGRDLSPHLPGQMSEQSLRRLIQLVDPGGLAVVGDVPVIDQGSWLVTVGIGGCLFGQTLKLGAFPGLIWK